MKLYTSLSLTCHETLHETPGLKQILTTLNLTTLCWEFNEEIQNVKDAENGGMIWRAAVATHPWASEELSIVSPVSWLPTKLYEPVDWWSVELSRWRLRTGAWLFIRGSNRVESDPLSRQCVVIAIDPHIISAGLFLRIIFLQCVACKRCSRTAHQLHITLYFPWDATALVTTLFA